MRASRLTALSIFGLLLGSVVACGGSDSNSSSAQDSEPVTLHIGTNDPDDAPIAPVIEEFARLVAEHSDGSLEVEPVWRAAGDPPPDDWDQAVAQEVIDGEIELGLIPSAAWDALGVESLRALNAPFLVDSDALVDAVVDDLGADLLAGLDEVDVTGLALLPEGLRHVFAFGEPLVNPSDFEGATIRAPRSDTVHALFEALGATADDANGSAFDEAVSEGSLAGAESSFVRAGTLPGGQLTATGNVTLFPKVNALVVNTSAFDALSEDQQAALRTAAAAVRSFVQADVVSDTDAAQEYCNNGGIIVLASDADRAALADAAGAVYADLETDASTEDFIARIRELKAESPAPPQVAACEHSGPDETVTTTDPIPLGDYARTISRDQGVERGLDMALVDEMLGPDGVQDVVLEVTEGRWTLFVIEPDGSREVGDLGTYTYDDDGNWVTVSETSGCRGCTGVLAWTFSDGVLTLAFADGSHLDDEILMVEGDYTLTE